MPLHDAYARLTPYERLLPGDDFPARRFPAIAAEAERRGVKLDDPAAFALLGAATEALQEWTGDETDGEAVARYAVLLFHAFHHHAAGTPVYLFETSVVRELLERFVATGESPGPSLTIGDSVYLQLPQHLVWARSDADLPPSSLDGVFRTATGDGRIHILPVGGMVEGQPGFTVVPVPSAPLSDEPEWLSADMRPGGADFRSSMPGAELEGLYEIATVGEAFKMAARAVDYLRGHPDRTCDGARPADAQPRASTLPSRRVVGERPDGFKNRDL